MTGPAGGTPLHAEWLAPPRAGLAEPPAVLLHGFTQNASCWGRFGELVAASRPTLAVDAPGHGGSTSVHADLPKATDLLGQTLDAFVGRPGLVIGYSMGGRLALHLALARPDLIAALVLIGATAGIDEDVERAARRAADDALAEHVLAIGVEPFIDEWLAQPLFASLSLASSAREERLSNDAEGLASSLRLAGTGTQHVLWDRLAALSMPVLVLAGADDGKFRALGERLAGSIGPNAESAVIDGVGHAVQLEAPDETAAVISSWLDGVTVSA